MKFLCLICAEKVIEQMPETDAQQCFEEYRTFAETIRQSGSSFGHNGLGLKVDIVGGEFAYAGHMIDSDAVRNEPLKEKTRCNTC